MPAMLALLFVFPHQPTSSTPSFTRNGGVAWLSEAFIILCQVVGTPEAVFDSLAKPITLGFRVHSNGKLTASSVGSDLLPPLEVLGGKGDYRCRWQTGTWQSLTCTSHLALGELDWDSVLSTQR